MLYIIYGSYFLINNIKRLAITDDKKNKTMRYLSYLLSLSCLFRIFLDIVFVVVNSTDTILREYIPDLCLEFPNKIN